MLVRSKVALIELIDDVEASLGKALKLIGGIADLNTPERSVVVKVGVFDPEAGHHATVGVVDAIIKSFDEAPKIFLAESDNYRGLGSDRLQIWKSLFSKRVVPFNLSEDKEVRRVKVADEKLGLSHVLFKPNVFVSTHIPRVYEKGSVLKNLLGLVPDRKKVRFHKKLETALLDMYQAVGGIDLAVLDGTHVSMGVNPSSDKVDANVLIVGRDAVAVEAVGAALVGMDPLKMRIIKEAMKRGLGEGDLKKIEIVGSSLESVKKKIADMAATAKKTRPQKTGPQTWGGRSHHELRNLVKEGFFALPNKRTKEDVVKAFEAKGLSTKGKEERIAAALALRVKRGILKKAKSSEGWVYWTE
jgi:uncharacterized protein (DUF362 family)